MKRSARRVDLLTAVALCSSAVEAIQPSGFLVIAMRRWQQDRPILAPGGPSAATALQVETRCTQTPARPALARFNWQVAKTPGQAQRIDVTMFRDGFRPDKAQFQQLPQLRAAQNSVEWDQMTPGVNYYWRVLTLTPKGWVPSATARYEAPICPTDETPGPKKPG